jgi:hypothetical protein
MSRRKNDQSDSGSIAGFVVIATPKTGLFFQQPGGNAAIGGLFVGLKGLGFSNLRFDKRRGLGDDSSRKAQGRGELEARDKRMSSVLRFFVRTCHIRFRSFGPKASTDGVCPDAESPGTWCWGARKIVAKAYLQKNEDAPSISVFYERNRLNISELRLNLNPPMQVLDFSRVSALFCTFFAIFHTFFQTYVIGYKCVIKIKQFKRQICVNQKNYL